MLKLMRVARGGVALFSIPIASINTFIMKCIDLVQSFTGTLVVKMAFYS